MESTHLLVVSGVSSCLGSETKCATKEQKSDEPMCQSRTKSSLDDTYPSTIPDMVVVAAHLTVQPSGKLCTIRQGLRAPRACWQHDLTAAADAVASIGMANSTSRMSESGKKSTKCTKARRASQLPPED